MSIANQKPTTNQTIQHEILEFSSEQDGPCLVIFGASHGNEHCGTEAIRRLATEFEHNKIELECGSIIMVPVCNLIAYEQNKRYINKDINRNFYPHQEPTCPEEGYTNVLTKIVNRADYFIDLHSTTAKSASFVFDDYETEENYQFCKHLGVDYLVTGWPKIYDDDKDWDSATYARHQGIKASAVVECGQHDDSISIESAYETILNAAAYLKIIKNIPEKESLKSIDIKEAVYHKSEYGDFSQEWKNFDFISKGTMIAQSYRAEQDMYILLPNKNAEIGKEWFYVGTAD